MGDVIGTSARIELRSEAGGDVLGRPQRGSFIMRSRTPGAGRHRATSAVLAMGTSSRVVRRTEAHCSSDRCRSTRVDPVRLASGRQRSIIARVRSATTLSRAEMRSARGLRFARTAFTAVSTVQIADGSCPRVAAFGRVIEHDRRSRFRSSPASFRCHRRCRSRHAS
jgi:hypothetical protein